MKKRLYVSISEAAQLMGCCPRTISRRIQSGWFTVVGKGRGQRILVQSLLNPRRNHNETQKTRYRLNQL